MNPFLRYLADKNSAHTQTDRQTDRHTPMTTRPCGLRRAGNNETTIVACFAIPVSTTTVSIGLCKQAAGGRPSHYAPAPRPTGSGSLWAAA